MRNGFGEKQENTTTIVIKSSAGNGVGVVSFIFGFISIFFMSLVFVPLAVLFGIIAVIKKQFAWGVLGLFCAFIGFLTSPVLLGVFGVASILAAK